MSSIIVKISQNGSSQEYLFSKLGPIIVGSDPRSDLHLDDSYIEPKLLEIKVSGGNIFIKELGAKSQMYLDSIILPYREEVRYHEGECISIRNTNYQIHVSKQTEVIEPPPFFEGEFKERLERMNLIIREKETELKSLEVNHEKKKIHLDDLDEKLQGRTLEKNKLEIELSGLRSQKEAITQEIRKQTLKKESEANGILELRDFVKKLENEEKSLKELIVAQNLVLLNLKEERDKKSKEVDQQRIMLTSLQLDATQMEGQLSNLKLEYEGQEKALEVENSKVQKVLSASEAAMREGARVQGHMATLLIEKALLDHDVRDLQSQVVKLEESRKTTHIKLQELNRQLDVSEKHAQKVQQEIQRREEEEENLRNLNGELRAELIKAEEKLSLKKNQLNQVEFQNQEATRKLSTVQFELERESQRLKQLVSEEKAYELKMMTIRDDLQNINKRTNEDVKQIYKRADEEKHKLNLDLASLRSEIEDAKNLLSKTESDSGLLQLEIEETISKHRVLIKEKQVVEVEVTDLKAQKGLIEAQIQSLKTETLSLGHERNRAQRELSQLQIKLMDCETQIKERVEEARLELENFKRDERAKMVAEKSVYLSEVEAFKQKSLIEVENEYRKKQDDIHQQKIQAQTTVEEILKEARKIEAEMTHEANSRLRDATAAAHEREIQSHNRIKEAQDYFKAKEIEADSLIQKSRLESREMLKKSEVEILEDLAKRKQKLKKFLTMKQETGLLHIKAATDQHMSRMRRDEEKNLQRLEELKRKELKKIAKLRNEELTKQNELKDVVMKELRAEKEKAFHLINEMKKSQELELGEKRKTVLEHINTTKVKQQLSWEEEIKREKELFSRSKKDRIANATLAVMNVLVTDGGIQTEKELLLREKIKNTLEMAIDGQNATAMKEVEQILDFNPLKRKKIIPVFKKYTLRIGVPAAVALVILADIGSFRSFVVNSTKKLIQQQQSASEMYVNQQKTEWKEKHTFNPSTTPGYKATFTDNIIYTTDFEKVMESEEFQNDWILKVHDFMVKNLELSEDVAINYISAEGTLLKDLSLARKDLHPQFLDTGLKKMNDLEKNHLGWLKDKISDLEKMQKFEAFRKDYYDKYYQEKFVSDRGLASERKP